MLSSYFPTTVVHLSSILSAISLLHLSEATAERALSYPLRKGKAMTMDQPQYPTLAQKVTGQLLRSSPAQDFQAFECGLCQPSLYQSQFKYGN
ncbi:hypothetical protein Pfo_001666 [Paulownia fortunei]|nr:hypothetical protein Pfo_001666 [Paulownia fortunei]